MIADIVIIVFLIIFLIVGIAKGFMKQILGLIGTIVAIVIAFTFCKNLANLVISHSPIKQMLSQWIAGFLGLPDELVDAETAIAQMQANGMPEFFITAVQNYIEQLNQTTVNLSVVVSDTLAQYIIVFVAFILIFIAVKLGTLILKGIAKLLKKVPVVNLFDRIAGAVIGLIKGLLIVYILLYVIDLLQFDFMAIIKQNISESFFANFLKQYNPLIFLLAPILTIITPAP